MAESPSRRGGGSSSSSSEEEEIHMMSLTAKDAVVLFQARRFEDSLDLLCQLFSKKPDDPKILHNIAIVEYLRDNGSDPAKLLEVLDKVKKTSEELNHVAGEQLDLANTSPNNNGNTPTSKGSGISNSEGIAYAVEYDTSISTLNTAIVFYNLQQYAMAMSVLEPLFENIEPIDETAALRICLLMLDITLASRDAAKAADIYRYMEKVFGFAYSGQTTDVGSNAQSQSQIQTSRNTYTNMSTLTAAENNSTIVTNADENILPDDNQDYENFLSTLDNDSQSIGRPDMSRATIERPPPANGLKLTMHLYKVRLLLLTRNLKATKREVKMAMKIARGRDSSTALLLKAQLEYSRGNNHKAIKLLTTCCNKSEQGVSCIYWNNLGCIHHQLKKDHLAAFYLKKAYFNSLSHSAEQPIKQTKVFQDKSQSIMYNCGMLQLLCGNPLVAAECFQQACSLYYTQPLLWIRLAECCILAHEKRLVNKSCSYDDREDELKICFVGSGKWRHLVLLSKNRSRSRDITLQGSDNLDNNDNDKEFFLRDKPVKISMKFARQCLQNALLLLSRINRDVVNGSESVMPCEEKNDSDVNQDIAGDGKISGSMANITSQANVNGDGKEAKGNSSSSNSLSASVEAYEDSCKKNSMLAKQAALAKLAYVELCLENPLKAYKAAETLLKQPGCSRYYQHLAHIYAAESLCLLNRPKEAAEHIFVCIEEGNNAESCNTTEEGQKWKSSENSEASGEGEDMGNSQLSGSVTQLSGSVTGPSSIFQNGENIRAILYVNLAAVFAMEGDLPRAYQYATEAVSLSPTNAQALLSVVYVELLQGRTNEAILKLKQCQRIKAVLPN